MNMAGTQWEVDTNGRLRKVQDIKLDSVTLPSAEIGLLVVDSGDSNNLKYSANGSTFTTLNTGGGTGIPTFDAIVKDGGTVGVDCTHTTISAAVSAFPQGAIFVKKGTSAYTDALILSSSNNRLLLFAENQNVVWDDNAGTSISDSSACNDVQLYNFRFFSSGGTPIILNNGSLRWKFTDCYFDGNAQTGGTGITLTTGTNFFNFFRCTFDNWATSGIAMNGVESHDFTECTFLNIGLFGIDINSSQRVRLKGSTFLDVYASVLPNGAGTEEHEFFQCNIDAGTTGQYGIYLDNSPRCVVDSNIIKGFGTVGIYFNASSDSNIINNVVVNSITGAHGIHILGACSNVNVNGNVSTGNAGDGLRSTSPTNCNFSNNVCLSNGGVGLNLITPTQCNAVGNNIRLNTGDGIFASTATDLNITNNTVVSNANGIVISTGTRVNILGNLNTGNTTANVSVTTPVDVVVHDNQDNGNGTDSYDYSTLAVDTYTGHTWINGKGIYRQVIALSGIITGTNNFAHSIASISTFTKMDVILNDGAGVFITVPRNDAGGDTYELKVDATNVIIIVNGGSAAYTAGHAILEFTKP